MKYGLNILTKKELNQNDIINRLDLKSENTLFINKNDDWNKFNDDITTIIERNGILEPEDDEKYAGYIYYDVSTNIEKVRDAFINIKDPNIIIEA